MSLQVIKAFALNFNIITLGKTPSRSSKKRRLAKDSGVKRDMEEDMEEENSDNEMQGIEILLQPVRPTVAIEPEGDARTSLGGLPIYFYIKLCLILK